MRNNVTFKYLDVLAFAGNLRLKFERHGLKFTEGEQSFDMVVFQMIAIVSDRLSFWIL